MYVLVNIPIWQKRFEVVVESAADPCLSVSILILTLSIGKLLIHSPEKNTHAFHIHSFIKCIDRVCFYHLLKQLSSSERSFLHPASFRMTKNMTRKTSLTVWSNLICESHWSSTSSRPPKRLQNRAEISMKQFLHPRYILITIFDVLYI